MKFSIIFKDKLDARGNLRSVATYFVDGKRVSRAKFEKLCRPQEVKGARSTRQAVPRWPLKSSALGVHPSQVKDAIEDSIKKGVPTHFDAKGRAEIRGRDHRSRLMDAYGAVDHDGGYGDTPKRR